MDRPRRKKYAADQAAVEAMRRAFNHLPIDGTVVIGEGERDEAPMLFIGEKVGAGGIKVDIALDPLEGTTLTAKALPNALAVMAMARPGRCSMRPTCTWTRSPSARLPEDTIDLDADPVDNIVALGQGQGGGVRSQAPASSTGRGTKSSSPACARPAPRSS